MKTRLSYSLVGVLATAAFVMALPLGKAVRAQAYPASDPVIPTVFQAAGPSIASIQSSLDQFRVALGGINNGNTAGPLAEGRREINWDGGGATTAANVATPFAGFQTNRGALFTTPGSGFVQAPLDALPSTFGNLTYDTIFQAFSPVRLFSPISSNITDVTFFVPGNATVTATTRAFGAVFTDVDGLASGYNRAPDTMIEYYGAGNNLLFTSAVPASPGSASLSFFGAVFTDGRIARVRIRAGNVAPGPFDDATEDIVMLDDFVYAEPQAGNVAVSSARRR